MKKIYLILFLTLFFSCKQEEKPDCIMPVSKMADIYIDMLQATNLIIMKEDAIEEIKKMRLDKYKENILQHHNLSDSVYQINIEYYTSDNERLKEFIVEINKKIEEYAN